MSVAETEIKWNHVNGEDRMDVTSANPLVSPCVNALLELNNVENAVVLALGTLRSGGEASVWIGSSSFLAIDVTISAITLSLIILTLSSFRAFGISKL